MTRRRKGGSPRAEFFFWTYILSDISKPQSPKNTILDRLQRNHGKVSLTSSCIKSNYRDHANVPTWKLKVQAKYSESGRNSRF